jgi:chemotaxis protein MotB
MDDECQQAVQEAVGGYFKDPRGSSKMVGSNKNGAGDYVALKKEDMLKLKEQLVAVNSPPRSQTRS